VRERFDPPLARARFVVAAPLARNALLAELGARSGWDAARVERVLWHGGLHLDGRPHDADDLPDRVDAGTRAEAWSFEREPEAVPLAPDCLLAEGPDWLAADKPPFAPTQRTRASRRVSFEAALRDHTGCASLVAVHRLDRETSGVVLFAKTPEAAARLGAAFAEGRVAKRYVAWVSPSPAREAWEVEGWIGRVLHPTRYAFALAPEPRAGWKWSHSRFERRATDGDRALVACAPTTGRTHQLRVHLAAHGSPIAGDVVYGGVAAERLLLHATALEIDGEAIRVDSPAHFHARHDSTVYSASAVQMQPNATACARVKGSP
jgi:23S rRNA-/tRNA-specific pseudouridylate synthase